MIESPIEIAGTLYDKLPQRQPIWLRQRFGHVPTASPARGHYA